MGRDLIKRLYALHMRVVCERNLNVCFHFELRPSTLLDSTLWIFQLPDRGSICYCPMTERHQRSAGFELILRYFIQIVECVLGGIVCYAICSIMSCWRRAVQRDSPPGVIIRELCTMCYTYSVHQYILDLWCVWRRCADLYNMRVAP